MKIEPSTPWAPPPINKVFHRAQVLALLLEKENTPNVIIRNECRMLVDSIFDSIKS